ncbi:MAG: tetratricopeptide repeat protein [Magnetococcus sp. YQC-5]
MISNLFSSCFSRSIDRQLNPGELMGIHQQLYDEGETFLANELYRVWLRFNDDNPLSFVIYYNLAVMLIHSNELQEARKTFEHVIRVNPAFFLPYYQLGILMEQLGETDAAIEYFNLTITKTEETEGSLATNFDADYYRRMAYQQIMRLNLRELQNTSLQTILWNPQTLNQVQSMAANLLNQPEITIQPSY